jgi:hypothetical protein
MTTKRKRMSIKMFNKNSDMAKLMKYQTITENIQIISSTISLQETKADVMSIQETKADVISIRETIADVISKETIADVISQETIADVQQDTKQVNVVNEGFSKDYPAAILQVQNNHIRMSQGLRIQDRTKCIVYTYLKSKNYYFSTQKDFINQDGKRVVVKHIKPDYPMRMTFFNGGKCHFPYDCWKDVFKARALDIEASNLLYDNDFARSEEGVKLYFELDYRSKDTVPDSDSILQHVTACQDVVKQYFCSNHDVDYSMWVLLSTPKPKFVKDEMHPVIAMGCHIIFKNIVINCTQGAQLCESANLRLEKDFDLKDVVDCCYKKEIASLRPIYCRKLEKCLLCLDVEDMRINCESCRCRGKVPSGSIYTASYYIDSQGVDVYENPNDLVEFVSHNMLQLVIETSIIPERINLFTLGYNIPLGQPTIIPFDLRSKHKSDSKSTYVYKRDRRVISSRNKDNYDKVDDPEIHRLLRGIITNFHPVYNNDYMLIANISKNSQTYFVDLKGTGKCFCRIHDEKGLDHQNNRIFFTISKRDKTISQHCYDKECRRLLHTNKELKKRVTEKISPYIHQRIFLTNIKLTEHMTKQDTFADFIENFGK